MSDRDDRILTHIGLYQISLRSVIEEVFFEGRTCGNVLQRLLDTKRIQVREGLPGRLSYYQLTRTETPRYGFPESRARALQNQALHTSLAVLWFCNMGDTKRHRLEKTEVERIFSEKAPVAIHCVERSTDAHRLFRVKVTDPETEDSTLLRSLRKAVSETAAIAGFRPWLETGRYSFAVLTETETRVQRIRQIIASDDFLSSSAQFLVETAPGVRTLSQVLHERQLRSHQQHVRLPQADAVNASLQRSSHSLPDPLQ